MFLSSLLVGAQLFLAIVVVIVCGYAAYWIYFRRYNFWAGKRIKSDKPIPLLGTTIGVFTGEKFHVVDKNLCEKNGRLFGTYAGVEPILYVADPELLKLILVKDFNYFSTRREIQSGNPLLDNMLSVVKGGDQWRNLRHTMTPAFSTGKLKKMIPIIGECAQATVDNFRKYSEDGSPVNCKSLFGSYSLDVIANVAFGTKLDSHNDPNNIFIENAKKIFSVDISPKILLISLVAFVLMKLSKLLGFKFMPEGPLEFFKATTETIVKRREENKEERHDVLQLLVESMKEGEQENQSGDSIPKTLNPVDKVQSIKRKPLTKDEFLAQPILFFLAGYDTTATTLTTSSYFLALNPDCQKKAAEEADRIWKNRAFLDSEALHEAKYLGAVIDETLRMFPPAVRLERKTCLDYELGDTGFVLPKGMMITVPVYAIHHDAEFFPEPEKFKPERFEEEKKHHMNPYTYLPFGAGPRNCIAMRLALLEVKLLLLHILKDFSLAPCSQTKIPIEFGNSPLLQPKDVFLQFTKRI